MYRWVDHTGELELELEAATELGVFEEALAALGGLLAEWLSELAYLAESEGFVPARAERLELTGKALEATVVGRRASPSSLVKAVTYHRLGIWEEDETWRARVILDV